MATSLYNLLQEHKVVIPIVQRDYAQGRQIGKAPVIRKVFLNALRKALKDKSNPPLELDFVYGYIRVNKIDEATTKSFIPLDGQQRLTTLFLLHWFVAVKENKLEEAQECLKKFTYETRHSSKVFCEKLVEFSPTDLNKSIKSTITNEPWFFTSWKNDPTVSSMLTMLDAIQEKFMDVDDVWPFLTSDEPKIVFHLLPMEKLGLPDDLYIKMNSRGKELTDFEHFKSRFSEILTKDKADIFNNKIDKDWSDLFWNLYKEQNSKDIAKLVDSGFLRFFSYITDVLIFKNNIVIEDHDDEFEVYKRVYAEIENVNFLFSSLDVFQQINLENPSFFEELFYVNSDEFDKNKTRLFFSNPSANLFKKCADSYDSSNRTNLFSIGEQLMLFACLEHLINESAEINTRVRTLRNLITNSEDTVRKENMPTLLHSVTQIILNNSIDNDTKFNTRQADEERAKQEFIRVNETIKETIYRLEDHHLLQGCIAIFKMEEELYKYAKAFLKIFINTCNYDKISRALLCFGDYSQKYDWRKRLGNHTHSVWRELFTPSQRRGDFDQTHAAVYSLLSFFIQNPTTDLKAVISDAIDTFTQQIDKPKDWKYYYIKYSEFRKNEEGFYYWRDPNKQYEAIMMRRTTLGGFHWSPFLYAIKNRIGDNLVLENYGAPLFLVNGHASLRIKNWNIGFKIEAIDEESQGLLNTLRQLNLVDSNDIIRVKQNDEGFDIEDRVEKGINIISEILALDVPPPNIPDSMSADVLTE
ncbi:DUF262 domain-containing protein [Pontibacter sp. 13R65]|uniref:DUF262 domain-containing protein n=1 Tax=Pontibacter sp. 13R65 TaxID=3127458 RepID=UPI00301D5E37